MEHLNLEDVEDEIEIPEDEEQRVGDAFDPALCLVGRFLTNRPVRTNMVKGHMSDVWTPVRGVTIKEVNPGIFIFRFFHHLDVQKVLKGGPWFFNKHMLILGPMGGGEEPEHVPLYTVPFWVQVYNLPAGYMSKAVGQNVGNYIGEFLEYDEKNSSDFWRKFMRIRVMVDVRRPLVKTKKVKKKGDEGGVVNFKYERLGIFCYYCGLLGHTDDSCDKLYSVESDDGIREWGPELRPEVRRRGQESGGRWLREDEQVMWQTPNQERDTSINGVMIVKKQNGPQMKAGGADIIESSKRHDLMAALIKNPSLIGPPIKTRVKQLVTDQKQITASSGTSHNGADTANHGSINIVEDIIVSEKKRMRNGQNKEDTTLDGVKANNEPINMHIDMELSGTNNENSNMKNEEKSNHTMNNNKSHFLLAGPGTQACQEQ
jgi:hypothetical protein